MAWRYSGESGFGAVSGPHLPELTSAVPEGSTNSFVAERYGQRRVLVYWNLSIPDIQIVG